jgi:hypothetical protein
MIWIGLGLLALVYLLACVLDPVTHCWACGGYRTGRVRRWRDCARCGGSGERVRLGARLWRR